MMKETAFIFAAGLGTRLRPLTDNRPKALVRYKGTPLLDLTIQKMVQAGIRNVIVNVHHFPDMMIEHLRQYDFGARIRISDERAYLRDTAGGLKFAEPLLGDTNLLILYNVDIVSNVDIRKMIDEHLESKSDVTLAVRNRKTSRYLIFNQQDMRLCGWRNIKTGQTIMPQEPNQSVDLAFSGVHIMNREVVQMIPTVEQLSLIPFYLQQSKRMHIRGYRHDYDEWLDVGKYDEFHNILS